MVNRQKLARWTAIFVAALILSFFAALYGRRYVTSAWNNLRLVNLVVNLIPTILSIVFAFVVDKDLVGRVKSRWIFRASVILCGVLLSGLLWHQGSLADKQSDQQIKDAVHQAVTDANAHSDEQFKKVTDKVGGLNNQVQGVSQQLTTATGDITTTLNTGLSKVQPPKEIEKPKLIFSLYPPKANESFPTTKENVRADADGNYRVDFAVFNDSEVPAESIDMWVDLCKSCAFAEEPSGLDKPKGITETTRHRFVPYINAGASTETMSVLVRFTDPGYFIMGFRYTCKTCGRVGPQQKATIFPLQNVHIPAFKAR